MASPWDEQQASSSPDSYAYTKLLNELVLTPHIEIVEAQLPEREQ
jgi:hypothetical protein